MTKETDAAQLYPRFTTDMKKTHKLLLPQMAPIHFRLIAAAVRQEGYDVEVMQNTGPEIVRQGLMYVHNDACYPALLVIGQFIDALKSGKYDIHKTALIITQTGGGCRASNYIHLLRKALVKAGFPQVPVASINFSGYEKDSGFRVNIKILRKAMAACLYGDELMSLSNQIKPYEHNHGETMALVERWCTRIEAMFASGKGIQKSQLKRTFQQIAEDFARIPFTRVSKVRVGIVGEIYVKYSPLANNRLEDILAREECEVKVPGLLAFVQYCLANAINDITFYGGSGFRQRIYTLAQNFLCSRERWMVNAVARYSHLKAPVLFEQVFNLCEGFIGQGMKMGEGWLLTAEMVELLQTGFSNIICAQPFGCLPNHIVGKGMIKKLHKAYPQANITPIDYDPGATRVNQENRIKLMLATARDSEERESKLHAAASAAFQQTPQRVNRPDKKEREQRRAYRRIPLL